MIHKSSEKPSAHLVEEKRPLWTTKTLQQATRGACSAESKPVPIYGLSIDSRTLKPGDLFVALRGERYDGHSFVKDAFLKGASAALVSERPASAQGLCIEVPDTKQALRDLSMASRQRASQAVRVGITGSAGKTGTKSLLNHVLSAVSPATFCSQKSFNNHWGLPFSLASMPQDTRYGIFEIGMNHAGEVRDLSNILQPHIGLITTVGLAHREFFSSLEGIASAKAEIFEGMAPGGTAVLNRDIEMYTLLEEKAQERGLRVVTFGTHRAADVRLCDWHFHPSGSRFRVAMDGKEFQGFLPHQGRHVCENLMGVLGVLSVLQLDVSSALEVAKTFEPLAGRGKRQEIVLDGKTLTLIDEAYNANPLSMHAAINCLGTSQPSSTGRRVAILGDMGELGDVGIEEHQKLKGVLTANKVEVVILCGALMRHLYEVLPKEIEVHLFDNVDVLLTTALSILQDGDMVLVKASNSNNFKKIITALGSA